jgi:hypothetical protein
MKYKIANELFQGIKEQYKQMIKPFKDYINYLEGINLAYKLTIFGVMLGISISSMIYFLIQLIESIIKDRGSYIMIGFWISFIFTLIILIVILFEIKPIDKEIKLYKKKLKNIIEVVNKK